ncbi:DUF2842 domain-containing protein [Roseococcus sp. DSY-14]|uniref:DUF2842 domain-containing protein n=1 Tax=Roseococcus sp. DSY-14 TaxID=3369650 RepID=UPI00387B5CBA
MSRVLLASLSGVLGFLLYVAGVMVLGDWVVHRHWALQFAFYALAGIAWVWPAKWLMFWAAGKRA